MNYDGLFFEVSNMVVSERIIPNVGMFTNVGVYNGFKYPHYVYSYCKKGVVKYVGVGSNVALNVKHAGFKRALDVVAHTNLNHYDINNVSINIVGLFVSRSEALEYESKLIQQHGIDNLWNRRK